MTAECKKFDKIKAKGDEAFRAKKYDQAFKAYSSAAELSPENINVLLNRSITALRMGKHLLSLQDAVVAKDMLAHCEHKLVKEDAQQKWAKAYYREGSALSALCRHEEAVNAFRKGLLEKNGDTALFQALRSLSHHMTIDWIARYFTELVIDAERPNAFSPRDGKLLKPPIDKYALSEAWLQTRIRESLLGRETEFRMYICNAWRKGKEPTRCILSTLRAYAYLLHARDEEEGAIEQSLKDARAALAYMPKRGMARAHAVHSSVLEFMGDYAQAIIEMLEAKALQAECEEYILDIERLKSKLDSKQRKIVEEEGAAGLRTWLEDEREKSLPEFMRKRPKYYYYYEWMKKRICEYYPELPEPVMDKLLAGDVDELDILLQYPKAIKGQVEEYLEVLDKHGPEYLESYETPRVSWEEMKALKHGSISNPGEIASITYTDHSMVAGGGTGQLTDAERLGLPVKPELAPDDARDRYALEQDLASMQIEDANLDGVD